MENSYTSFISFEKFLIASATAALVKAGWGPGIQLGVGWTHIEAAGERTWVYKTQANGLNGSDAVLSFSIHVTRRGRSVVKFLGSKEAFAE